MLKRRISVVGLGYVGLPVAVAFGRTARVVGYESTVYPGATEDVCAPVLERVSGLRSGVDRRLLRKLRA